MGERKGSLFRGGVRDGGHRAPWHPARRLKKPPQKPLEAAPLNLDVNLFRMKTHPDKVKQMQTPAVVLW